MKEKGKYHSMNQKVAEQILETVYYGRNENGCVRFRTFHALDQNNYEVGRITCAFKPVGDNFKGTYESGYAFCSPHDTYSKKVGQALALGRLISPRRTKTFAVRASSSALKLALRDTAFTAAQSEKVGWMQNVAELV